MNRKAKKDFYYNSITAGKGDSKRLWKYLRDLVPEDQKDISVSLLDNNNNNTESDPLKIENIFNNYFTTVADQYVLSETGSAYSNIKLENFISSKLEPGTLFSIPETTVSFVEEHP